MQGLFVLAGAINRAGSTEPAKIQAALSATYLIQLQGKEYVSVWPESRATNKLQWPMAGAGNIFGAVERTRTSTGRPTSTSS
jgi:branched-chain amino acid transport system substrate-binding protein